MTEPTISEVCVCQERHGVSATTSSTLLPYPLPQVPFSAVDSRPCPAHSHPEPVEAPPLAWAVHLLGGLELHIAGGGLCGWCPGVYAVYLP